MVARMGDDHRIHGIDRAAEKGDEGDRQDGVYPAEKGQAGSEPHGHDCHGNQHLAPVHAVGHIADRNLNERAGKKGQGHHDRDVGHLHADSPAVDRPERPERAVGNADEKDRDHCDRRIPPQQFRIQPGLGQRGRACRGGERGRQEGERIDDRADDEEHEAVRVADGQEHLASRGRSQVDHRVNAEDPPPDFVRGPFVEPAFHDHGRTGEAEAGDGAQDDPGDRLNEQKIQEHRDGAEGG